MSVRIIVEVNLKPDIAEAVKARMPENLAGTLAFEGCTDATALVDQDDPNRMLVVMEWESRRHYEAYLQLRTDIGGMDQVNAVSTVPYRISYYDILVA